ncbi:hypothetical protein DY000_02053438 [Brassica cretica]|uniref:Zinc knuckle CX2CX4HX4C domain-containing protein n=1 Tax=Brassica cretica TaxID=69181 RepID=A0ABQ7A480_BRACR|nr:hypothetical protein DY000_02053438 [Brassica cretica]
MNRPRKRKESSLLDELKELELLGEGELVDMPELENEDLIEENSMSIIVRCLKPTVHKVGGLVKALPPIWSLEDSVKGRGVGENKSPNPGPEFLCRIPFWIRIRGIPLHLLKKQAVEGMMGPLGRVEKVELHAKNSSSVEYVRALVWINTEEPLQFKRTARFKSGEIVPTELEYEKLIKVCFLCKRLTHDQLYCDMQEDLAADYWESRARSRQNTRLEARSSVSRQGKEDNELRNAAKGGHRGKNVVGETSQIWKPKSSQSVPLKGVGRSRSIEESPHPGNKSTSQGMMGAGASSGASQESPSVFNRLGD